MRIEDGIKLDFQDVLIKPKRSRAPSRSSIQLERTFVSKYAGIEWTGVPIIAANMYGTGTMAMAAALSKHHMLTALHKHYSVEDLVNFFDTNRDLWDYTFYTIGINSEDVEKLKEVTYRLPLINRDEVFPKLLCVDAANFYTEFANDRIKEIREQFPRSFLMAGNVVSYEMTEQLILSGVDICKCGIGGGCFVAGTKIKTKDGYKNIEEVDIDDYVLTHRGRYKRVVATTSRKEEEKVYKVRCDGKTVVCTGNHEFLVLHKKYADIVNDDNIDEYAEWVEAKDLTKEFFVLKIKEG